MIEIAKDWTGNNKSIYTCLGASNHTQEDRQINDFYATEPKAIDVLIEEGKHQFCDNILEPAAGTGHLSERLIKYGYKVTSYDLIDRGYCAVQDFFEIKEWDGDIITNPPYKIAREFVEHAIDIIPNGNQVAMFLKLTFLESKARKEMFKKYPLKTLYVSSSRLQCAKNGDFITYSKGTGTAVAYGWYIFEKGYKGEPIIKWIN